MVFGMGDGFRCLRLAGGGLIAATLLAGIPVGFGSCGIGGDGSGEGDQSSEIVTAPTDSYALQPTVTQKEAESVVRSWFADLEAQDYQKAESLTTGEARQQTRQLVDTIRQQEQKNNVSLQFQVQKLDLQPASGVSTPQGGQAVRADFAAQIIAQRGPLRFPALDISGQATFVVEPTPDGPRISDVQNISGLSPQ